MKKPVEKLWGSVQKWGNKKTPLIVMMQGRLLGNYFADTARSRRTRLGLGEEKINSS
jgi:hypothetical protein